MTFSKKVRVDIKMSLTDSYAEYTSKKSPVTFDMGQSLMRHLKRIGSQGRVVDFYTNEVLEEW